MLVILARVRDFLVAMALAWVGVTIETQVERVENAAEQAAQNCAEDAQAACHD